MMPWIWVVCWVLLNPVSLRAQGEEESVKRAEPVSEVPSHFPGENEPIRKAEHVEKPRTDTGRGILPDQPVVLKIESPEEGQVMPWETVDVFIRVQNYALGEGGNRIRAIVDNGSPIEHGSDLKPIVLRGLSPGSHSLRVYPVKPDGKILVNTGSEQRINFYVRRRDFSNFQPEDHPYLTVNLPLAGMGFPDADGKIWLDFRVHNAVLGKDKYRVKVQMNGVETILSSGVPYGWAGLEEGRHRMVIELVDEEGDPVSEIFARVERTFEIPRIVKAVNPNELDSANLWLKKKQQ
jgi:hypothetical protein